MVFLVVSLIVVAALAVGVALGRAGGAQVHLAPPTSSAGGVDLPDGPVTAAGVEDVRFDVVVRGYRMDQVDAVLDRLRGRLADLEDELEDRRLPPETEGEEFEAPEAPVSRLRTMRPGGRRGAGEEG